MWQILHEPILVGLHIPCMRVIIMVPFDLILFVVYVYLSFGTIYKSHKLSVLALWTTDNERVIGS